MTDRERIYNLVDKVCDLSIKAIDKITELKQENSKLKQRVAELEKPKRKFRAMTYDEFCKNSIRVVMNALLKIIIIVLHKKIILASRMANTY